MSAADKTAEPGPAPRRSIARNAAALLTSQSVTWVLTTIVTVVQSRLLGPAGSGELRIGYSLWAIGDVFIGFGAATAITMEVARGKDGLRLIAPAVRLQALTWVAAAIVISTYAAVVGYNGTTLAVVLLLGIASLAGGLVASRRAALIGLERMGQVAAADMTGRVVYTALVIAALVAGANAVGVAATAGAAAVISALLIAKKFRSGEISRVAVTPTDVRLIARRGRPFLLIDSTMIVYQQVDVIVISLLLSESQIGWYGAANLLFGTMLFIPTILVTTIFPSMSRLAADDPEGLRRMLRRAFSSLLLIGVPIGVGTTAVARPIVVLLYGEKFRQAGPILAVLGLVMIVTFPAIVLGRYALIIGRQRIWAVWFIGAAIITVPLDLVLVRWMERRYQNGALGGALSYLITETIIVVMAVMVLAPDMIDRYLATRLLKIFVAGAVMGAVAWRLREQFLAVPIISAMMTYTLLLFVLRAFDAEELQAMRGIVRKLRGSPS